jgi:hypothetical protein
LATDWLEFVQPLRAYTYQAALICEDCARKVVDDPEKRTYSSVADTGDSNDFPQPVVFRNETDSPDHCSFGPKCANAVKMPGGSFRIGCPLECCLTRDGLDYVRESIATHILFGSPHQKAMGRLWFYLFSSDLKNDSLESRTLISLLKQPVPLPPLLKKALANTSEIPRSCGPGRQLNLVRELVLSPQVFTDLEYVYGGGIEKSDSSQCDPGGRDLGAVLWRLSIDSRGQLEDPRSVGLPQSEALEREIEDLLDEAISEDAWT